MQISADIVAAAIDNLDQDVRAISEGGAGTASAGLEAAFVPSDPGGDLSPASSAIEADDPGIGHQLDSLTVGAGSCTPLSFTIPDVFGTALPAVTMDYCNMPYRVLFRDVALVSLVVWYLMALSAIATEAWTRSK